MHLTEAIAVLSVIFAPLDSQLPAPPGARESSMVATAHRASVAPIIDGRDADAVWQSSSRISQFRQFEPRQDADPSLNTEFRVAYDERNLYVFVRMFDPHPDSIMHALTRRDVRGASDQIKLLIDSYNDRRSGYEFAVNPDGVKRDYSMFNDGNEDESWNGVWDVETTVDSLGWTAEFRIPLSQLRYADAPAHTFGFGIWRDIERYKERVSWPLYSTTGSGVVSQLGQLTGISGITSARSVELTPYTVTKNVQRALITGGFERVQKVTAGGDLKIGLTPNLTVDATVNPDFGQVEADPAVLNLSAFETFLAERRPFFVEGTGLYQFRLNCYIVVDCSTNEGLFYSRRIGRAPQLGQLYGDASTATATPIAAAAKLTGRIRNGLSVGLLDAFTQRVEGSNERTVEPRSNYAVLRAQQDLRDGEASISLIGTAVNRALDNWSDAYLHESAYVAGASFRNRFGSRNYELAGSITASRVAGTPASILRTQRSAVHYYQQPDDEPVLDSTRTSLGGHAEQIKFGKYGGGITRFETSLVHQSAGFEVNDLGYLRRADVMDWSTWAALSFRNARGIYRWAQVNANHWETWNTSGLRLENALNFNGHMGLKNNWDVHLGGTFGKLTPSFCDRCTRGGPALRQNGGFYPWFGFNADSRRTIVPSMWVNLSYSDDGRSTSVSLGPSVRLRFSTQLQASVGANLNQSNHNTQWFGNFTDNAGVTHYSFAHLDQTTRSLNVRLNYTATPDLTFEFYGEPFVTRGRYTDIREISATPDADSYDARFQPYVPPPDADVAFRFSQLRTNAVLRWEYRPGSTVFLVWAHGRSAFTDQHSTQSWRDEYRDLFELHPDNTFLIKVAYWLNR
ncbi:MAG TPA: DUF5916 domain-containing protein [Longimicrobiales bacterium]|nr:DUF5916 domain-containing protein [Longimicrobiales bacterium]